MKIYVIFLRIDKYPGTVGGHIIWGTVKCYLMFSVYGKRRDGQKTVNNFWSRAVVNDFLMTSEM